jgi:hypothetical protein
MNNWLVIPGCVALCLGGPLQAGTGCTWEMAKDPAQNARLTSTWFTGNGDGEIKYKLEFTNIDRTGGDPPLHSAVG